MTPSTITLVIGPRMRCHLDGSSLREDREFHGYGAGGDELIAAIDATKATAKVTLSREAAEVLLDYAECLYDASADDGGPDRPAALRMIRKLNAAGVTW